MIPHASLVATPLKPRMPGLRARVTRVTAFFEIRIPIGLETRKIIKVDIWQMGLGRRKNARMQRAFQLKNS